MPKQKTIHTEPAASAAARIRRGYFECRFGQLHVHHAIPGGGGFEEQTPLLALHSAAHSGRAFSALLSALGRDRSAFAPDLPGFGESDPPTSLSIAAQTAAIADFLDTMRLREVDLIGWGLGMRVALELAATRPGIRRLVIAVLAGVESPLQSADAAEDYLRSLWAATRAECAADAPPATVLAACGERVRTASQVARFALAEQSYPLRERLTRMTLPLLVLHPSAWPSSAGFSSADLPAHARRAACEVAQLPAAASSIVALIQDFLVSRAP